MQICYEKIKRVFFEQRSLLISIHPPFFLADNCPEGGKIVPLAGDVRREGGAADLKRHTKPEQLNIFDDCLLWYTFFGVAAECAPI
jgi:hypothetical protein